MLIATAAIATPYNPESLKLRITIDDSVMPRLSTQKQAPIIQDDDDLPEDFCEGQPNGNYNHPYHCTKFVTCTNGYTSVRDCPVCNPGDLRCSDGRTQFDGPSDACLLPEAARCNGPAVTKLFEKSSWKRFEWWNEYSKLHFKKDR